jgi:hypothetical protein
MLTRREAIVGRFAAYLRPRSFRGARAVIAKNAGHRANTTTIHPLALRISFCRLCPGRMAGHAQNGSRILACPN